MSTAPSSPFLGNETSRGWKLEITDLTTVIPAFLIVFARLYTKFVLTHSPGWEDLAMILAMMTAIGHTALDFVGIRVYQIGKHQVDVPTNLLQGEMLTVAMDGYLYVLAMTLTKISLLIFLYRIFSTNRLFRWVSWVLGAVISLWALLTVLIGIFSCHPLAASFNYKLRIDPKTVCYPESYEMENYFGFCNIFADLMLLCMPMPLLWTLQMRTARKIGVATVFGTGVVICAIAILRQYMLITSPDGADGSWDIVKIKIWMTLEVNLAIICACLPVLQPLFRQIPLLVPFLPSHLRSRLSGHSTMEKRDWPKKLTGPKYDVEAGFQPQRLPWREPDEISEDSIEVMFHQASPIPPRPSQLGVLGSDTSDDAHSETR